LKNRASLPTVTLPNEHGEREANVMLDWGTDGGQPYPAVSGAHVPLIKSYGFLQKKVIILV
jgi:hypothetical protein